MKNSIQTTLLLAALSVHTANAAIALDRTRVIYPGEEKSVSLSIKNESKTKPYLAQSWIEDSNGTKITSPLMVVPPLQRVEPGADAQIKIIDMGAASKLPQDKESVLYFNVREIPPVPDKVNTLQIALQTKVKLFYRPKSLTVTASDKPFQSKLTLTKVGGNLQANNTTPYYITLSEVQLTPKSGAVSEFKPVMLAPNSTTVLPGAASAYGDSPVVTYINDYGGHPRLVFACNGNTCAVKSEIKG